MNTQPIGRVVVGCLTAGVLVALAEEIEDAHAQPPKILAKKVWASRFTVT